MTNTLKDLRKKCKLSVSDMALLCGMPFARFRDLEKRDDFINVIRLKEAQAIAKAFDTSFDDILKNKLSDQVIEDVVRQFKLSY